MGRRTWGFAAAAVLLAALLAVLLADVVTSDDIVTPALYPLIAISAIMASGALGFALQRALTRAEEAHTHIIQDQTLADMAAELSRFGGWEVDLRDNRLTVSREVARIHEIDPDTVLTLDDGIRFYAPEYRDRVRTTVQRCIDEGTDWNDEWELITATGRRVWVRAMGAPIRDETGRIIKLQGSFQDIDARKRAEESAERSRQQFQQLADAMPMLVWTATQDGRMDFLNRAGFDYVAVSDPDLVMGDLWLSRLHADDRQRAIDAWMLSVETGTPYLVDFRLRRGDGQYRWHQSSAVPIRDRSGDITQWFGSCIDMHEQRRLADRLAETLEAMGDAFLALDREWRIVYINAAAERLSGARRDDMLGELLWDRFPGIRDSSFQAQYQLALDTNSSVYFVEFYPPLELWLEVSAHPTEDGLVIYLRDISREREAEERSRQAQRLESIGQLTGGVAHDFNNLLTVIVGNAELLADTITIDPEARQIAEVISDAAERGAALTQRLLAFARRQPLDPRSVDVDQLVAEMERLLRRTLGEHIEITIASGQRRWPALVDPGQLENALLNLCINARDAMPAGGTLRIATSTVSLGQAQTPDLDATAANDYIAITVSDTGTGIDQADLPRVFDPFFTTKEKSKGTGLGLAMVYGFAKQSNGHVSIDSQLGIGTTVTLYLPRSLREAEAIGQDSQSTDGGTETILLVEDDDMVRDFALSQLMSLGYDTTEAPNGIVAMEILRQRDDIRLLFTDVVMPGGMNGKQLAEAALLLRPDIKVLFTSGYSEDLLMQEGRLASKARLLTKPYSRADLARTIRAVLDQD